MKKSSISLFCTGAVLAAFLLNGCTKDTVDPNPSTPPKKSIADIVGTDREFSVLRTAVNKAGLAATLGGGTLTLFAPTNSAFAAVGLDSAKVAALSADALKAVLQYHVLSTAVKSSDIAAGINKEVTTLGGTAYSSNFAYGEGSSGPVSYGVSVNGSRISFADIEATNGIVHKIDAVITPIAGNIVATLQANPAFSLLVQAVTKANLAGALSGPGPFTVLAPTNEAFAAAGIDANFINNASASTLADILKYHVLNGRVFTTNFTSASLTGQLANSLPSQADVFPTLLEIDRNSVLEYKFDGTLNVTDNKQRITDDPKAASLRTVSLATRSNLGATNGVIHAIDRVLMPADQNIVQLLQSIPRFSLLVAAVTRAGLAGTLSGNNPLTVFAPTNNAFISFLGINPKLTVTVDVGGVPTEVTRDKRPDEILAEATNAINAMNPTALAAVLNYHVATSRLFSNNLQAGDLTMASGGKAKITTAGGAKIAGAGNANPATITKINLGATNGIIHVIDAVLKP